MELAACDGYVEHGFRLEADGRLGFDGVDRVSNTGLCLYAPPPGADYSFAYLEACRPLS